VETANETEEAMMPPAQYQPGESDSVPTFRESGPLVRRISAKTFQEPKTTDDDTTIETDGNSKKTKSKADSSTVSSKKSSKTADSISTKGSKTSKGSKETSELTSSINLIQVNMQSMQQQF
jgi:hypothetical protein